MFWGFSFVFIILDSETNLCDCCTYTWTLHQMCHKRVCLILLDDISSVNNPYFQATASNWTIVNQFKLCHIFFKMYFFLCRHFDISLVLLFKRLFLLPCAMMYFSVTKRSHLLVPHLYGVAYAAMLHFRLNSVPLHFNCQICFEGSVLCS